MCNDIKFEENIGLVNFTIKKYFSRFAKGNAVYDYEDLFQIGCMALDTAIKQFDENHGASFSTYATSVIFCHISNFLRKEHHLRMNQSKQVLSICSLDKCCGDEESENYYNLIADGEFESDIIDKDYLNRFIKLLTTREKEVMLLAMKDLKQADIGKILGIKQCTVAIKLKTIKDKYNKYQKGEKFHSEKFAKNKKILNIDTGEVFNGAKEAAEKYGISRSRIYYGISQGWRAGGYYWKYI